ncbi:hypothetical protein [Pseudoalteromonas sp. T1lg23B]|uniref:hypothetical protein n=1 Tax=Pseudoalteromonas sp. T1lg23B TaxID=2077097 RepID=UPI000CF6696B|nr:hypothetical protein [Pseudoalteromonas sp. T1lg23B]
MISSFARPRGLWRCYLCRTSSAKLSTSEGGFKEQSAGMQASMMGESVVANAMAATYANLNNGVQQQSANVNSAKSTTDMLSVVAE